MCTGRDLRLRIRRGGMNDICAKGGVTSYRAAEVTLRSWCMIVGWLRWRGRWWTSISSRATSQFNPLWWRVIDCFASTMAWRRVGGGPMRELYSRSYTDIDGVTVVRGGGGTEWHQGGAVSSLIPPFYAVPRGTRDEVVRCAALEPPTEASPGPATRTPSPLRTAYWEREKKMIYRVTARSRIMSREIDAFVRTIETDST